MRRKKTQTFNIRKDEILNAIELAEYELKPGAFVDKLTKKSFTAHCKVCAVGGIAKYIPRLNTAITDLVSKTIDDYNDVSDYEEVLGDRISDILIGDSQATFKKFGFSTAEGGFDTIAEQLEQQLNDKEYFPALSTYFEDVLKQRDSNKVKKEALQTFVCSFFPSIVKVEVPLLRKS